jgi:hypothetical protein
MRQESGALEMIDPHLEVQTLKILLGVIGFILALLIAFSSYLLSRVNDQRGEINGLRWEIKDGNKTQNRLRENQLEQIRDTRAKLNALADMGGWKFVHHEERSHYTVEPK